MNKKLTAAITCVLFAFTGYTQVLPSHIDTTFTEYFRRSTGWTGGDATISVPLPNGNTMWLFGDSYIDHYNSTDNTLPCLFQVRNCFTVQEAADLNIMSTYIDYSSTGVNQTYFKIGNVGNSLYWPGHGFVKNDTVFVFLEKYNSSTLAFQGLSIAKVLLPSFTLLSITSIPPKNGITMGKAVLFDESSGFYYIYGNKRNWIVFEPYVARTKFENLVSGNWEFFTGSGWSTDASSAKKICDDPVSPGFSVIKLKNTFYLVTQENGYLSCGLGRNIYSYSSATPSGKFQTPHLLYTVEDQVNGHYLLTYNAQAHPEFTENDELLVSYNVNDAVDTLEPYVCASQCKNAFSDHLDADSYRPKFVRVPFNVLGIKSGSSVGQQIEVEPNPAVSFLLAHLNSGIAQRVTARFINKLGEVMLVRENIELHAGVNQIQFDVSALPPDMYVMILLTENGSNDMPWTPKRVIRN